MSLHSRSIAERFGVCLGVNLLWVGVAISGSLVALAESAATQSEPHKPPAAGSPREIAERHNCWTDAPPADMVGEIPGHVLISEPGGLAVVGGRRLVHQALDQVFNGTDHGLTIHAFCR